MTARNELIDDFSLEPAVQQSACWLVAREVLRQVRFPEAIYLQDVAYDASGGTGTGIFLCARSTQFPNPDLKELTGGQLIDAATQMAYCLTGLMIHGGIDLLGLDFEGFKRRIHAHRIHAVSTEMTFHTPCLYDRPFSVSAQLQRFGNGRFCVSKRNPRRYFVRIELEGRQEAGGPGEAAARIFHARIAACHEPS